MLVGPNVGRGLAACIEITSPEVVQEWSTDSPGHHQRHPFLALSQRKLFAQHCLVWSAMLLASAVWLGPQQSILLLVFLPELRLV